MAYGNMGAAKSLSGVILPVIVAKSLDLYGFRTTIRAWTAGVFILTAPLLLFVKPRLRAPQSSAPRQLDLSFLKFTSFWMLQAGNVTQSLGYFLPTTYLASYAHTVGLSTLTGTLLISVLNGTSPCGSIIIGILNDHMHFTTAILISAVGSTVAVLLFRGLSTQVAMLAVFSVVYGFFAGGFCLTWPGVLTEMKHESPALEAELVFGLLAGGRGVGNVVSGPLSVALLDAG
ncbi:MAG: hypothetical protein M1833_002232 [Piccolia ochrophora]|nr:MAG: hypothetical protein M1833_002232 [Piccolia ochrophora]